MVPFLNFMGFTMHESIGTSLAIIVFNSAAVSIEKLKNHEIDIYISGSIELFGVLGALAGGLVAQWLDGDFLKKVFSFFTLFMAVILFRGAMRPLTLNQDQGEVGKNVTSALEIPVWTISLGFVGGTLSALLGIGSGAFMVPAMHSIGGISFKRSAGTSSYVSGIFALVGAVVLFKHIHLELVPILLVAVRFGTYFAGSNLGKVKSLTLKRLFAVFLCIIGIKMWS